MRAPVIDAALLSEDYAETHSGRIFLRDIDPAARRADRLADRREWWRRHRHQSPVRYWANTKDRLRPLRVGYVSGDFKTHSAAFAFSDLILHRDRKRFVAVCYAVGEDDDEVTATLRASADLWRDINKVGDETVARQIRSDEIDILVDLSGHTQGNRLPLFTMKPAPVQVHAIGYLPGTGLPEIDYIVLDPVIGAEDADYVERVCHMPCALHYRPFASPAVSQPPCLKNGHTTLGYFGRWGKVNEQTLAAWRTILTAIPDARLVLKDKLFKVGRIRKLVTDVLRVDQSRITFLTDTPHAFHLDAFKMIDVALDPFDANGGISSLDALWMGVPIVTRIGTTASGRVGASILKTLSMSELVADDTGDYIAIVMRLAGDRTKIAKLRETLRSRMEQTTISNGRLFASHVESLYRQMWRAYCEAP